MPSEPTEPLGLSPWHEHRQPEAAADCVRARVAAIRSASGHRRSPWRHDVPVTARYIVSSLVIVIAIVIVIVIDIVSVIAIVIAIVIVVVIAIVILIVVIIII